MNYTKAAFYLSRHVKTLAETAEFDQTDAAVLGLGYEGRQKKVKAAEEMKDEYETMCDLLALVKTKAGQAA